MGKVPKILYIGPGKPELKSFKLGDFEDDSLNIHYVENDSNVKELLVSFNPDAIITIGKNETDFTNLYGKEYEIRKKWIHLSAIDQIIGERAYHCAMYQILYQDNSQLISFFTPVYNTGEQLYETYLTLKNQTYSNWEWIIVNDSTDDITLDIAEKIAAQDYRVKVYDFKQKSGGIIGDVKYKAATLCRGYLLAELDHDDLLVEECAQYLRDASQAFPNAGFFYTDAVELNDKWESLVYGEGFACGYGKYKKVKYKQYEWDVTITPNINPKTIRHIVGVPNHIRAWRRDAYFAVGGHNRDLAIADDYELIIRTFLHTRMVKIPKLGYLQFIYSNKDKQNTHNSSRADIQRRVRTIRNFYDKKIADRFGELGIEDYIYNSKAGDNFLNIPGKYGDEEQYANYIYTK